MKLYNFIELYKTPLDPEYRNVYDCYSTTAEYLNFIRKFPYIQIKFSASPITKSYKSMGESFSVIVNGYDSMDLHDYNYMMFWNGSGTANIKFAFVLSVDSLNDGATTKSCVIHCKLDAWSNNYTQIKTSLPKQVLKTATFDVLANYDTLTGASDDTVISRDIVFDRFSSYQNALRSSTNKISVVWQRIFINKYPGEVSATFVYQSGGSDNYTIHNETGYANNTLQGQPTVFYIPVGIVDETRDDPATVGVYRLIKNCRICAYNGAEDLRLTNSPVYVESGKNIYINEYVKKTGIASEQRFGQKSGGVDWWDHSLKSDTLLESDYTMWAPFEYSASYDAVNNVYYVVMPVHMVPALMFSSGDLGLNAHGFISANWYPTFSSPQLEEQSTLTIPLLNANNLFPAFNRVYRNYTIDEFSIQFELVNRLYPYMYYKIVTENETIPLLPTKNYQFLVIDKCAKNVRFRIVSRMLSVSTYRYDFSKYFYLQPNANAVISYSQIEQYLRSNENRISLEQKYALMKTAGAYASLAASAATGNAISGALSALSLYKSAKEIKTISATKKDYENMLDNVNVPVNDGITKAEFLDDIYYCYANSFFTGTYSTNNKIMFYHNNGLPVQLVMKLTDQTRDYFDVRQTEDAQFTIRISDEDRRELKNAFDFGVTIWHINDLSNKDSDILTTMNKNVTNLYYSFIGGN